MHHRNKGRILGRERNQRKALIKGLLASLILHGRIMTTEAKAKETKNFIDQLVNKAKKAKQDDGRQLSMVRMVRERLPKDAADKMLSEDFVSRFSGRESGYTRVIKVEARKGDGARRAIIEFVS
ncbi:MAG: large subunit ribosomal protein [Patescibacteria group bacterium]|jgi:large subunit ribosomal protein L17|nr:large subunit ribosomal protein [Patescibacteria group bacterium]